MQKCMFSPVVAQMLEKEREEERRQLRLQFEERERVAREEHTTREQRLLERVQKLKTELKCDSHVLLLLLLLFVQFQPARPRSDTMCPVN